MSSVQEIEQAITHLSPQEQEELLAWMDDRHAQAMDARLSHALNSGAMDKRIREALGEHKAGTTRAL